MTRDDEIKLLQVLEGHIKLAKEVEQKFLENCPKESQESQRKNNFFVFHFLNRTISYCESIRLLVEKRFYHEAIILARTVLEGLIYFEVYCSHHDLADKWGFFVFYEDCASSLTYIKNFTVRKWKQESAKKFDAAIVDRAEQEFGLYFPLQMQRWHKSKGGLPDLINQIEDKQLMRQLREFYDVLYNEFSQIVHWSPSGVIGGALDVLVALAIACDAVSEMSKEADKKYALGFDNRIKELRELRSRASSTITPPAYPQAANALSVYWRWMHNQW
jgi:hypothetical protein